MKRALPAAIAAALLLMSAPATLTAAATRVVDHRFEVRCEGPVDGGEATIILEESPVLGDWVQLEIAYDGSPRLYGENEALETTEGEALVLDAAAATYLEDSFAGVALITATMQRVGRVERLEASAGTGRRMHGTTQRLEGTATLTITDLGIQATLECTGAAIEQMFIVK